jgi:hypothetical protein
MHSLVRSEFDVEFLIPQKYFDVEFLIPQKYQGDDTMRPNPPREAAPPAWPLPLIALPPRGER